MSMIGKTLGNFECTALLGKGGMGEVYQAKDQKLGRDVAIKVLPEEFARDADRVARFQREAKLLASLNHPNIAAIHGLEESNGTHFLVLELIEGNTLDDRINTGPIPVEESLKLALQIAEALEAAHEKGVIHRDLKPANIKITPEGKIKVLDFGLAKAYAGDPENMNLSNSPTLSDAATQAGVILGTAAYMPPEQAKGKSVDKRADIWAFGVVVFEMLSGRQLFVGDTVSETLASVLMKDVDFGALPPNLHPRIPEMLERCLQKDPRDRYGSIGDARFDVQKVLADPGGVVMSVDTAAEAQKKLRLGVPWIAAIFILSILIAGIAGWVLKQTPTPQITRFDYELPEDLRFTSIERPVLAFSHDGKKIAYATTGGLYIRSLNEWDAQLLTGTEGVQSPFFSIDGRWIGYFSNTEYKLKKISIHGGTPIELCDALPFNGARWITDNEIVYFDLQKRRLMKISDDGKNQEILLEDKDDEYNYPHVLPDGRSILYQSIESDISAAMVSVKFLDTGEKKELFPGKLPQYVSTGHIIYVADNNAHNLYAVPFNLNNLEIRGEHFLVADNVRNYAVSDSGILAYIPSSGTSTSDWINFVWVDHEGAEESIDFPGGRYSFPKLSPNGTQIAVTGGFRASADILILDLLRKNHIQLTRNPGPDFCAFWTSDGKRILFSSPSKGGLYWKAADGAGEEELLLSIPDGIPVAWSWSNNDETLVLTNLHQNRPDFDIGFVSMDGDRKWEPLFQEEHQERQPTVSPDGRLIAYASNEEGDFEVYIRTFPEVHERVRKVSTDGGNNPLWSPDGGVLYYRNEDAVMAVTVQKDSDLILGAPQTLFKGPYIVVGGTVGTSWDIHPNGNKFLMMKPAVSEVSDTQLHNKINIVTNWFEELKEKVPVD